MFRKLNLWIALAVVGSGLYLWNRLSRKPGDLEAPVSFMASDFSTPPSRISLAPEKRSSPYAGGVKRSTLSISRLRTALAAQPRNAQILANLGAALMERRQSTQEAIPYLEKSLRLDPRNGSVFYDLVGAYLETGLTERGTQFLNEILASRNADKASAHAALADLKATTGDPTGALVHAEAAKSAAPRSASIQSLLGSIYLQLRDPRAEDALKLAEKLQTGEDR